jgi:hypothetical protein
MEQALCFDGLPHMQIKKPLRVEQQLLTVQRV